MATELIAINAKTRAILGNLPYKSFSYQHQINGKGSWTATLPMSKIDPVTGIEMMSRSIFDVNRTQIVFVRDGAPLFIGLLTQESDVIGEGADTVSVSGPDGVLGPLERTTHWANHQFTGIDQLNIAKAFVTPGAPWVFQNFGIVTSFTLSGVTRDRLYYGSQRITSLKAIDDLSQLENGFDYLSTVTGTQATGFVPTLLMAYPKITRTTGAVLELGRNVSKLQRDVDGDWQRNAYTVIGQGGGTDLSVQADGFHSTSLSVYPEYDGVENRPTITLVSTAQSYANRLALLHAYPFESYELTVDPNSPDCDPTSFRLGDEVRLIAKRGRVSVDATYRVMSYSMSGDEGGNETLVMSVRESALT